MFVALLLAMGHFFPAPPAQAVMHTARGVLSGYGAGNAEGHIQLRSGSHTRDFYLAYPFLINGKAVGCLQAEACESWPAHLALGETPVTIRYWSSTHDGKPALIASALTYGP